MLLTNKLNEEIVKRESLETELELRKKEISQLKEKIDDINDNIGNIIKQKINEIMMKKDRN